MFEKNEKGKIRLINNKGEDVFFDYTIDAREAMQSKDEDGNAVYTNPYKQVIIPPKTTRKPEKIEEKKEELKPENSLESEPKKRGRKTKETISEEISESEEEQEEENSEIEGD